MRVLIFLSMLFLFSGIKPLECDCGKSKPSINESLQKSDLIAIGIFENDDNEDFYFLEIIKSWKGKGWSRGFMVKKNHNGCDFEFQDGNTYLVYGTFQDNDRYNVSICSRTKLEAETIKYELDSLDAMLPCIDSSLIHDNACQRDLRPVIGCDGVTYGNLCEARRHGIAKYVNSRFRKR